MVGIGAIVVAVAIQSNSANEILARSQEILGSATTVVGSFTQQIGNGRGRGDFHLKKDKKLAVFSDSVTELCDGFYRTTVNKKERTYTVHDIRVYNLVYMPGFEAFTRHNKMSLVDKFAKDAENEHRDPEPKEVRMARLDGQRVVSYIIGGTRVYLDPKTALPVGADFTGENSRSVKMRFQNVRLNVELDDSIFSAKSIDDAQRVEVIDPGMMRVGDRIASSSNSEYVTDLLRHTTGKKHSILVFFDKNNAANGDILAKFDKMRGVPKNVAIIGIARTKDWNNLFPGRPAFSIMVDAQLSDDSIRSLFGITHYPTVYVLDENSRVEYVQIGAESDELDRFLKGIGITKP